MRLVWFAGLLVASSLFAQSPAWVQKSNTNAQLLIDVQAKYTPESAASEGVQGLDREITVISSDLPERLRADISKVRQELSRRSETEKDPLVKQDLGILIAAADRYIRRSQAREQTLLPYSSVGEMVFEGVHGLLDDQIAPERRPAVVDRMRRYTGMESGYQPTTLLAERVFREKLKTPGLIGPSREEVQKDLENSGAFMTGIGLLIEKYKIKDYEQPYAKLKEQMAAYDQFVRDEVLPKARTDFRLPPALYAINLEQAGVDYKAEDLAALAHRAFTEIQEQMKAVAEKVAKKRGLASADYRTVVQALKKEQLSGDAILPHYEQRLAEIEGIIRREHLLTLPERPAIIRLATAAETAQQPAPHMSPPPLLNNHGQRGQFVLPLGTTGTGGKALKYDDFTFNAASWTLTAHEARPGHELQFDAMVERGVSVARALFAFNSTNVEGWGLYSEWFMLPYMSDEGQLISLQLRLLRAARAFLDPELQWGKVTPEQAMQVLENDVVLSKAFATEEVERFTFRSPGQAVSYFDGYTRMRETRAAAEAALGSDFKVQRFHDFVLAQGLLPPDLLRKAVMDVFVPGEKPH
jgi:hypothetical protein